METDLLAVDYDGTLATDGVVSPRTLEALARWKRAGGKCVLVSGRERPDLEATFPEWRIFDLLVLENGALLVNPTTGDERPLGPPPPPPFLDALRARNVPVSVGRVIVATWTPHEVAVLETIRSQGLELELIFNKGAVMVLPSGINKGTGLRAALSEWGRDRAQVVAAGDAENDHSLLEGAGLRVAVANALPALKAKADWVTPSPRGEGIVELVDRLLAAGVERRA